MGNNGSRTGHIVQHFDTESHWTQSCPKHSHYVHQQNKVLPEKGIDKRLRATNNGIILHAGGTLSGRHQKTLSLETENKSLKIFRANSISSDEHLGYEGKRAYIPHQGGGSRYITRYDNKDLYKEQIKKFGSEPDLRNSTSFIYKNNKNIVKGKKKYKAPSPPNHSTLEKSNSQHYRLNEDSSERIIRRSRLYKTKQRCSSPIEQTTESLKAMHDVKFTGPEKNSSSNMSNVELNNSSSRTEYNVNRFSLPEIRSSTVPEFQSELKEAVQRIKSTKKETGDVFKPSSISKKYSKNSNIQAKHKLKTLDHNNKKENAQNLFKHLKIATVNIKENSAHSVNYNRGQPPCKESTSESHFQTEGLSKKVEPYKLFYFGMKESIDDDSNNNSTDIQITRNISYNRLYPVPASSGSDLSSEIEMEEIQMPRNKITLQLRPILPKKQLEIPRFSPAAAWRQLSAVESNLAPSTIASEDSPILMEERIEKLSRLPPPSLLQTGPRSSYDKSGDSGISGDAGPVGFDENPDGIPDIKISLQLPLVLNRNQEISWTPQQDLEEEDSSTDEEIEDQLLRTPTVKFTPKSNVFSLSLPRDNQSSCISRSKKDISLSNSFRYQSGNWFLSKSAPNSLKNDFNSLEFPNSKKCEDVDQTQTSTRNVSRVMYLPDSESTYKKNHNGLIKSDHLKYNVIATEKSKNLKIGGISKSCENISSHMNSLSEPEDLQDPPAPQDEPLRVRKQKKFTFQSTIRQIERKLLAEKLSREADKKEKKRLSELAAMQRVEEEFKKKRARYL
ncbi:hypothetical protein FQA39_LY16289 [Lamprigera yunnana]|nr:hypothetical protein FQA39_LY16289 [Lamprigera yunnana]